MDKDEVKNIINTIRLLSIDMINAAKYGHPGIALGAAPILYALYANHLRIDPKNPDWIDRDRFIMSAGHGSALLYATLFMAGYDLTLDDLVRFSQINSKTPGYPIKGITPGVDYSTGPLGQGFAAAVGMAMAEKYLSAVINRSVKNQKLINHNIYCLVSDGDLEEGISYEAANLAGLYGLNNLIVLYDSNDVTEDNRIDKSSNENVVKRFDACGWNVDFVADGNNIEKIDQAIYRARRNKNRPTIIEIKTTIGKDSFNENTSLVHSKPLTKDDIESLHRIYKLETDNFEVTTKYVDDFRKNIDKRMAKSIKVWNEYKETFLKSEYNDIQIISELLINNHLVVDFAANNFRIQSNYQDDLRESNSQMMNIIASKTPFFLGGSADLASSCKTRLLKYTDFSSKDNIGRNINFGIREHAMAAIVNGMTTYNLRVYCSTHLIDLDYELPAIRMASLMKLPAIYIFTHDTIEIGEDGSLNQPIEQLNTLRNIPDLDVYRPADINEVIGMWDNVISNKKTSSIVISHKVTHILGGTSSVAAMKGGYIVKKETNKLDAILLSCGSDLTNALIIANNLKDRYDLRVVSMPSQEVFLRQDKSYQEEILPKNTKIIAMELSTPDNWTRFTNYDNIIGLSDYGISGKPLDVLKAMKVDISSLESKVLELL